MALTLRQKSALKAHAGVSDRTFLVRQWPFKANTYEALVTKGLLERQLYSFGNGGTYAYKVTDAGFEELLTFNH